MFEGSAENDYKSAMAKVLADMAKANLFGHSSPEEEFNSSVLREEGNNFYRQGKYFQAVSSYSRAYTLAQEGSKDAALALANRSAVLMSVGLHKDSIADSKLVLAFNYPEELKYKIYQRMAACYKMLGEKQLASEAYETCCKLIKEHVLSSKRKDALSSAKKDYENGIQPKVKKVGISYSPVPSVSYGARSDMPGVSSALELKESDQYGTHFVASRKIKPGDVLFVDVPLVSNLIEKKDHKAAENREMETNYTHCFHCFKNCFTLSPCQSCYFAMFCSEECRSAAINSYHKTECQARNKYTTSRASDDFTSNSIMVVVCCKMVSMFGVDVCIQAMTDRESAPKPLREMLDLPLALYSVEILMKTRNLALQVAANCFGMSGTKKKKLAEFIVLSLMVFKRNAVSIGHPQYHAETDTYVSNFNIGWGIYMKMAYIIHSCVPNSIIVTYEGKTLVCFASEEISPGQAVSCMYQAVGSESSVEARREIISTGYNFTCKCEACTKGWVYKNYVTDLTAKTYPQLNPLYVHMMQIFYNSILLNRGLNVFLDKKNFQNCFKLQEAMLKAGIPKLDIVLIQARRLIEFHWSFSATQFNLDGKGESYIFAPDRDMAEELKEKLVEWKECGDLLSHHQQHNTNPDWIGRQWESEPANLQKRPKCACPSCV